MHSQALIIARSTRVAADRPVALYALCCLPGLSIRLIAIALLIGLTLP